MKKEQKLRVEIDSILNSGKNLRIKWNCGNDDALTTIYIDNEELSYEDEFRWELSMYIINYLDLPDAGDFQMEGEGIIVKEQGHIYIKYESETIKIGGIEDEYSLELEMLKTDELYSGKKILFPE